ncbi:MAG: ATP synthase F1 subunit gamma [Muribaculaceae bacterium]|nr:ATP synthase F1 subunit gamma [Muribaculaceae bacterium]
MATLRELKGRIGSVASSEKITGAMKMISSAKMHKAEQALRRLQPYRQQVESVIGSLLSSDATFDSPLLMEREVKRVTVVVWGSDDGLCGAYNVNISKQLAPVIEGYADDVEITVIPVGSKIAKAVTRIAAKKGGFKVATMEGVDSKSEGEGVKMLLEHLKQLFVSGETDRIDALYMNFQSVSRQRPVAQQLIPVVGSTFKADESGKPFIFEPDAATIFRTVIPMYLLAVVQDIFTENRASEQAARVMAMQSANDNAKKLLDQLRLEYNKLRQQSITTELLDIVGGQVR